MFIVFKPKEGSKLNDYEIAILYDPDLEVDLSQAEVRIKKIFESLGGSIKSTDNWGKRKLAYPIKHNEHAIYVFYTVSLPPASVSKVDATLSITDEVIRFLITKPDLKAMARAEVEKAKKAEQAARRASSDVERQKEEEPKE